jgi:hypothetical protein
LKTVIHIFVENPAVYRNFGGFVVEAETRVCLIALRVILIFGVWFRASSG